MPILHGKAKGSQLQENLHIPKMLSEISTATFCFLPAYWYNIPST